MTDAEKIAGLVQIINDLTSPKYCKLNRFKQWVTVLSEGEMRGFADRLKAILDQETIIAGESGQQ